ncbi:MAG TPA: fused MFS/spermidine synthase [Beijerinckiaceae bacterium]|nr:fused MFS/spermidine synthase [Beijerinckiaceae bacterium]
MTSLDVTQARGKHAGMTQARLVLIVYAVAIFASAFLLFSVQPMFTRMVLPKLGGTPAVWSVAMVFFQTVLLIGYLYAHLSVTWLSARAASIVHLSIMGVAALGLPIAVSELLGDPPQTGAEFWLFAVFALSAGLPFFAIAGNGPLLQQWYHRAAGPSASNPYTLYGASNLGSFGALLLYPFAFEPLFALKTQSHLWSIGFAMLAVVIALCGVLLVRAAPGRVTTNQKDAAATAETPSSGRKLAWVFYAFVPSGYLVAVTAHISTDIASAPLLWIIPLALFLLTFVAVFRDTPLLPPALFTRAWPIAFLLLLLPDWIEMPIAVSIALHVVGFFVATMVCHQALYASRPAASHLTLFYLLMSLGGVLGGVFASLVSPHVFSGVHEYLILMVLVFLCLPGAMNAVRAHLAAILLALAGAAVLIVGMRSSLPVTLDPTAVALPVLVASVALFWTERHAPLRLAAIGGACLAVLAFAKDDGKVEHVTRSFFGVNKVMMIEGGKYRAIVHGNTNHGAMRVLNDDGTPATGRQRPVAYYRDGAPYETAISRIRQRQGGLGSVAITGLGAGGLACHARDGEKWTFFEIDPEVIRIAQDTRWFRSLSDCTPDARIIAGDARLTLAKHPGGFDLIALDAFSSDAIPVHLLTEEAIQLYFSKLNADGALIIHITNRYMELRSVVAAISARLNLVGVARKLTQEEAMAESMSDMPVGVEVAVLARKKEDLGALPGLPGWDMLKADPSVASWSDDYSNIVGALLRK